MLQNLIIFLVIYTTLSFAETPIQKVLNVPETVNYGKSPFLDDDRPFDLKRIIAVGDLHGDFWAALRVLKMAGLVDQNAKWIAAPGTVFVQTGDIVDRGPDTIELYNMMVRLRKEAEELGSRVIPLLGNHELMNMMEDLRYVHPGDTESFGGPELRKKAWSKDGFPGSYLRTLGITTYVNGTVFVHGGISPKWAKLGILQMNSDTKRYLNELSIDDLWKIGLFTSSDCPVWYRGYAQDDEPEICEVLDEALEYLQANAIVVGHTPQLEGKVVSRCNGKIQLIDVGISKVYGRNCAALEILNGKMNPLSCE
ncbi:hypothetical protein HK098_002340 [Nowakowskiella sp. JEL0407]|nr:hypothetical protein HK098_002340 [Nowakowskiella sp. JEL0407]